MKFLNFIRNKFRKKEAKLIKEPTPKLNDIFEVNENLKTELKALEKIEKDLKSVYK